jgi:hypothetical protein
MIRSGLNVPTPAIPMPDLAVPYAAPAHPNIMAAAIPPCKQARLSGDVQAQLRGMGMHAYGKAAVARASIPCR